MREIHIDLSNDRCSPEIFGGYIAEHNATKIIIKLPNRMLTSDITKYQFVFKNSINEIQSDNEVDLSDINNGYISALLTENQTTDNSLALSVIAIVEENSIIMRKAKTPIVHLKVRDSIWDIY